MKNLEKRTETAQDRRACRLATIAAVAEIRGFTPTVKQLCDMRREAKQAGLDVVTWSKRRVERITKAEQRTREDDLLAKRAFRAKEKGLTLAEYDALHSRRTDVAKKKREARAIEREAERLRLLQLAESAKAFDCVAHVDTWASFVARERNRIAAIDRYYKTRNDPHEVAKYRLRIRLRQTLKRSLKLGHWAKSKTMAKIGYTSEQLMQRLVSTMPNGATIDDFMSGALHIDHIKPCVAFDFNKESDIAQAYALDNLQLLWAKDNWAKNSRYEGVTIRR